MRKVARVALWDGCRSSHSLIDSARRTHALCFHLPWNLACVHPDLTIGKIIFIGKYVLPKVKSGCTQAIGECVSDLPRMGRKGGSKTTEQNTCEKPQRFF